MHGYQCYYSRMATQKRPNHAKNHIVVTRSLSSTLLGTIYPLFSNTYVKLSKVKNENGISHARTFNLKARHLGLIKLICRIRR